MSDTPETDKNLWDGGDEFYPKPMRPDSSGDWVPGDFARRLERERDEYKDHLIAIENYGTEEINAAVDLRSKLAAALVELDTVRANFDALKKLWNQSAHSGTTPPNPAGL